MEEQRNEYLELTDWRRQVAALWEAWRGASADDPAEATRRFRDGKDRLFRAHPQSPVPAHERASFPGLAYWAYDPAYRMTVRLDPLPGDPGPHGEAPGEGASPAAGAALAGARPLTGAPPLADAPALVDAPPLGGRGRITLPSSGPEPMAFRRIGRAELQGPLSGRSLSVFWLEGYGGGLFLPFRDATSGTETYGAGRYLLDTIKSADHGGDPRAGTLVLDLNMAFHPSCAYDPRWSCPLAPPENRLDVAIPAGERLVASERA